MDAVVLVEGESDRVAVETLARRRGRDLAAEGVAVVPIGGAQAIGRVLREWQGRELWVAGLCDAREAAGFARALGAGAYVCDPDLEGELVRALGAERVLELVEARGQLGSFLTYQKQPAKRAWPFEEQVHGWLHNWKIRYAAALVEALDLARVPRPLDGVLEHVDPRRAVELRPLG
ncbi:MAG TPA: TOPRIM nucleotidyl transferase/hydrolase domain-containing protein [Gaiellaceae bacterium]|nr:TOPRIM nucleotidyl transferase/hydrolase domain-containing protein [Gaiellaceae bacterium]